ncbi:MAG: type II toxin-antitoxin system VapC family toxin [Gaiellaceae bacterium]
MTLAELVVDASVVVRGLTTEGSAAETLERITTGDTRADAPDLLVAELSNALALAVRTGRLELASAQLLLSSVLDGPIVLHPVAALAPAAIELASGTGLSAYDAYYAVLADTLGVPLVTTDRRLGEAVPGAVLLE